MKRKASQPLKMSEIRCKYTDTSTGFTEYFVVPINRVRGQWYSESVVDEQNLTLFRYEKRKVAQLNKRQKEFPKPAAPKPVQAPAPAPVPAPVHKPRPAPPKKRVSAAPNSTKVRINHALPQEDRRKSYETLYYGAKEKHKLDTFELLKQSAAKGEKRVSVAKMGEARKVNIAKMRRANAMLSSCGGKHRTDAELTAALSRAESDAIKLYMEDATAKRNASQN